MYLDYPDLINESLEQLATRERQHRSSPVGDRLKMLRLPKEGTYRSRHQLTVVLGYSERQLKRLERVAPSRDAGAPGACLLGCNPEARIGKGGRSDEGSADERSDSTDCARGAPPAVPSCVDKTDSPRARADLVHLATATSAPGKGQPLPTTNLYQHQLTAALVLGSV
jgi:hypothetical protein